MSTIIRIFRLKLLFYIEWNNSMWAFSFEYTDFEFEEERFISFRIAAAALAEIKIV